MKADCAGSLPLPEVTNDGFAYIHFKLAEIFALGSDTTAAVGRVPMSHEPTAIVVPLDGEGDFLHFAGIVSHTMCELKSRFDNDLHDRGWGQVKGGKQASGLRNWGGQ